MGWAQPRPIPRTNDSAISSGTLVKNGNSEYVPAVINRAAVMVCHSFTRRTSSGITRRTAKVAMAKVPMITPMVDADRPLREP